MRILLIEDQAELAHLVAVNLRRSGFAVDDVGLVEDARAALETTGYDSPAGGAMTLTLLACLAAMVSTLLRACGDRSNG
jgi:DNA-binding response OmpR family regulator